MFKLVDLLPIRGAEYKGPVLDFPLSPLKHIGSTYEDSSAGHTVNGGDGVDVIYGNGGLDRIVGNDGDDKLFAGSNTGTYKADGSHGTVVGGGNATELDGGDGNDTLTVMSGAKGAFYLDGGQDDDRLVANGGSEVHMAGGSGGEHGPNGYFGPDGIWDIDTFAFGPQFSGNAVIDNFNYNSDGPTDFLDFANGHASISRVTGDGDNTYIDLYSGGHVTIQGHDFSALDKIDPSWGGHLF